jgi:hypothetical protein
MSVDRAAVLAKMERCVAGQNLRRHMLPTQAIMRALGLPTRSPTPQRPTTPRPRLPTYRRPLGDAG